MSNLQEIEGFFNHLCQISQKNIMSYYGKAKVEYKEDQSPVTIADQSTEELLREEISKRYPNHSILGEEFGLSGNEESEYQWVLDPIDGTKSFIAQLPLFGTLIAVLKNKQPWLGCIHIPCHQDTLFGEMGKQSKLNGKTIQGSQQDQIEQAVLLTTCIKDTQERMGPNFFDLSLQTKYSRTWGDCYGHFMVATGRADIMVDPILNLWDIAALMPCVLGSGADFYDLQGVANGLGDHAISSSKPLKQKVLGILNK